ncbi:MAG: hypothetical protein DMD50_13350 [Gemmatimonadetes bacterium]|nr:MAG: hypothetical protein DMD50_13350 [Gemmatimonadota bacterium]
MLVTAESLSLSAQIATTAVGALLAVLATTWLRTHTLARLELVLKSRDRCEWIYAMVFCVLAVLLAIIYRVLGLIPGRYAVGLTAGSTLVVLGVLWPPYMREARLSRAQRLVQRAVVVTVGAILLALIMGHRG